MASHSKKAVGLLFDYWRHGLYGLLPDSLETLALQETRGCTETRVHRDHARIRLLKTCFLYVFTVFTTWSLLLERDQPEAFHSPWPFENQVDEMAQQVGLSRFLAQRLTDFEPQARGLYRLSSYLRLAILQGIS